MMFESVMRSVCTNNSSSFMLIYCIIMPRRERGDQCFCLVVCLIGLRSELRLCMEHPHEDDRLLTQVLRESSGKKEL